MSRDPASTATAALRAVALLAAAGFIGAYLYVALARIDHPFEIEWMEGGSRGHVERLLSDEPFYGPPSLAFTPFIYTPLYFQAGAWLAPAFGTGFTPLRALSLLASLGCFALIFALVARETRDHTAAFLAAGVFAATFRISGAWFDLARVDSLFLLFTLAALLPLRFGEGWRAGALAGLLAACAFFTKQTALPILGVFALCALLERKGKWLAFFALFGGLVVLGSLALHLTSDGWSSFYVFELPGQHHARWNKAGQFWWRDVLQRLPVVSAGAVAFFAVERASPGSSRRSFYACLAIGSLFAAMSSRVHSGGYLNVLMPAYAGLAILFGLGIASLRDRASELRPWLAAVVFALCILQFGMLRYDLGRQIPSPEDRAAGQRLIETIRGFEGEVLVVSHGYLPAEAGKLRSGQWMAIADVLRGDEGEIEQTLDREIREAILARRWDAILLSREDWYPEELAAAYELREELFDDRYTFRPRTGDPRRPEKLYVPRRAP